MRPLPNVVWNLFLAIVPVVLALIVFANVRRERREGRVKWAVWLPVLGIWLVFLPNTCYLVTEWRHFVDTLMRTPQIYWMARHNSDVMVTLLTSSAFYITYSGTGLICFFLSIYPLDVLFKPPWVVRPMFFFLCSLGVYLGLIDRFNSWQVLSHPHRILHAAHQALSRPLLFLLICAFSAVLWLFYGVFGLTMEGAWARLRAVKQARSLNSIGKNNAQ